MLPHTLTHGPIIAVYASFCGSQVSTASRESVHAVPVCVVCPA